MKPFLIISGIYSDNMDHRQVIMTLHENNIDDAVRKIDKLIKAVSINPRYSIQVLANDVIRLVLRLSDQGSSYIEIKEIVD